MIALALIAGLWLTPVHGVVLATASDQSVIVRTDAVTAMLPAEIRRYRVTPTATFRTGTTIDALLDAASKPSTLRDVVAASAFAPGLPDVARAVPLELGMPLPVADLVNQSGRLVRLDRDFLGKTVLLSFIFTRCPDRTLCPAISGKFAYLQQRLDPRQFALVQITLDPQYDSPVQLRNYGRDYGADASRWALLTGTGSTIARLLDAFRISSMRVSTANFLHDDRLFIVAPTGRVAYIVETASWDPEAALAQARAVAGVASNPLERFKLALIAGVVAMCGGSQFAGTVLLELSLFTAITIVSLTGLWVVGRVLWRNPAPRR